VNRDDSENTGDQFQLVEPLSERELEILQLIADNLNKREIAERLSLAYSTVKWYTQQSYQKLGVHSRRQAVLRAQELGLLEDKQAAPSAPLSLPAQLTPFLGRQSELGQICHLLGAPDCRLLSLLGPGGVGKTRLAFRVAESLIKKSQTTFADGIYFVSLEGLSETKSIVSTIAEKMNFSFYDRKEAPDTQLLHYLRSKQALLILDNFEHLLNQDSRQLLNTILRHCPQINILVTSRTRLNLPGEHIFPTTGLEIPDTQVLNSSQDPVSQALAYSSIQLFTQSARRLRPDFELNMQNVHSIGQICQLLEGMPLGIELAATWVRILDPADILAELENSFLFLETGSGDSSEPELNLRSVFLVSWKLLTKEEQLAVKKLSVFQGSFSLTSAQEVASVSLQVLLSLADQSWLERNAQGRYQIHELLRQYAREPLKEDPQLWQKACDDYSAHFCDLLIACAEDWHTHKQLEALEKVRMEIQNIEPAWRWKVSRGDWRQMREALDSLCTYYEWRGHFRDGEVACQIIAQKLGETAGEQKKATRENLGLFVHALAWQSTFSEDRDQALQLLAQSQGLLMRMPANDPESKQLQALILRLRGERTWDIDREAARRDFLDCFDIYLFLEDDWGVAKASQDLGQVAWQTGRFTQARELLSRSLKIQERLGDRREAALSMDTLALTIKHEGELEKAERMQRKALSIHEELGAAVDAIMLKVDLAHTLILRGLFTQAISLASEGLTQIKELGCSHPSITVAHGAIACASLHQGQYAEVSQHSTVQLESSKELNFPQSTGFAYFYQGLAAVAQQAYTEAILQLEKSYSILMQIRQNVYTLPLTGLALAHIKLQQEDIARQHLLLNLGESLKIHAFGPLIYSIPALALLFAARGRVDLARELYMLGLKQPLFANSRWYKDVTEEAIASLGSVPPPEPVMENNDQEISPDFWTLMEKIRFELEK
jgi:predicted ATPase/DNA-binding CsgD family transcriptional regulator